MSFSSHTRSRLAPNISVLADHQHRDSQHAILCRRAARHRRHTRISHTASVKERSPRMRRASCMSFGMMVCTPQIACCSEQSPDSPRAWREWRTSWCSSNSARQDTPPTPLAPKGCRALEAQVVLEVLRDLPDKSLKLEPQQQKRRTLVLRSSCRHLCAAAADHTALLGSGESRAAPGQAEFR